MAPEPANGLERSHLARATWSLDSPGAWPEGSGPLPDLKAEGARLVSEVAASWSAHYIYTIQQLGEGDQCFLYECIFSRPTDAEPVPSVFVSVRFALAVPSPAERPRLLYSFEEGDLRHEWKLEVDAGGKLSAVKGQQPGSLKDGAFEQYLDHCIREKERVRSRGVKLETSFENTRLVPPPSRNKDDAGLDGVEEWGSVEVVDSALGAQNESLKAEGKGESEESELQQTMRRALRAANLDREGLIPPKSIEELLTNVFDAADEENVGELPHYEVARLLGALLRGFGLEEWDVHLLLTSAQENEDGLIGWMPFIKTAPEIIEEIKRRRSAYYARGFPGVELSLEAVKHCFGDECHSTAEALRAAFEQCAEEDRSRAAYQAAVAPQATAPRRQADGPGEATGAADPLTGANGGDLVGLRRRYCRSCLESVPDYIGPQEVKRLMEMLPEDESGFVYFDNLEESLEMMRSGAVLNALIETDVASLRAHLVPLFRDLVLGGDGGLKLWDLKDALLQADQICLSRLQVHLLLSLAGPATSGGGNVDAAAFLGTCCVVIPYMFNAHIFVETADRLILEHAEFLRNAENAELAALQASRVQTIGQDQEETSMMIEVDQDTVERTLIQVLQLSDSAQRGNKEASLPPEMIYSILHSSDPQVQSCQLSDIELCGLAAEMSTDATGEVAYVEHVKRWVPIIFELRKNDLLGAYLKPDGLATLGIPEPDLDALEEIYPLLPQDEMCMEQAGADARHSRRRSEMADRRTSQRGSTLSLGFSQGRQSVLGQTAGLDVPAAAGIREEPPPGRGFERRKMRLAAKVA
eukprot:CAMPEP_0170574688 /NCGR_PEP_ID=MMETSP0224-20130122/3439_1 /TAXON_ID=285029 /ORGANISM="Togula jolla, Strain CCCM 725" /LENGTH=810 /DNA_ID=CAMNT_0010897373 /DNA_START=20 /DNA_END=2453 /DNA_ORIENTATION=+